MPKDLSRQSEIEVTADEFEGLLGQWVKACDPEW